MVRVMMMSDDDVGCAVIGDDEEDDIVKFDAVGRPRTTSRCPGPDEQRPRGRSGCGTTELFRTRSKPTSVVRPSQRCFYLTRRFSTTNYWPHDSASNKYGVVVSAQRLLLMIWYDNLYSHKSSVEWNRDRQKVRQTINLSYTNIKSIPNISFKMSMREFTYRINWT